MLLMHLTVMEALGRQMRTWSCQWAQGELGKHPSKHRGLPRKSQLHNLCKHDFLAFCLPAIPNLSMLHLQAEESQSPLSNTTLTHRKRLTVLQDDGLALVLCAQVLRVLGIA